MYICIYIYIYIYHTLTVEWIGRGACLLLGVADDADQIKMIKSHQISELCPPGTSRPVVGGMAIRVALPSLDAVPEDAHRAAHGRVALRPARPGRRVVVLVGVGKTAAVPRPRARYAHTVHNVYHNML